MFETNSDKKIFYSTVHKYIFRFLLVWVGVYFFAMIIVYYAMPIAISHHLTIFLSILFTIVFLATIFAWAIAYNKIFNNRGSVRVILRGALIASILCLLAILPLMYGNSTTKFEISMIHVIELGGVFVFSYVAALMGIGWMIIVMRWIGLPYWSWVDPEDLYAGRDLTDEDS